LETIPQKIGIEKSKLLACVLLAVYVIIDVCLKESIEGLFSSLFIAVLGSIVILKMPKKSIKYYCSFGIESLPILKLVVLFMAIRF